MCDLTAVIAKDPEWDRFRGVERRRWRIDVSNGTRKFTGTRREAVEWCAAMDISVTEANDA